MKKDTLVSLSRIAGKTVRATSARSCTKTLLLAAAVGLALGTTADLHADWTIPILRGEVQYGTDYDASSGTITVQPSTDALVQDADISPNNYIISGGGSPAFFRNPGALNIRYNALVTGSVTLVGESVISSQVTGYTGSTGTLSGNLIGTARLTIGSWDLSLSDYNTAEAGTQENLPLLYDAHVGAHPRLGEEAAARSTFTLLGDNSGFSGDIRVAPFTTLQIGDGTDYGRGNLSGNNNILLTTDWKINRDSGTPKISDSTLIFNTANYTTEGVTFSGNISGNGAVIKRATGLLTLSGTNTFKGDLSVEAGQLAFTALNALGAHIPGRKISLFAGTTLSYVGTDLLLDFTPDLTLELVNRGSATLSVAPDTEIILHRLSGGAGRQLNKTGNGTLTLTGTESNPGAGLIVAAGTLNLAKTGGAYAVASGGLTINDAGKVVVTEDNSPSQLAPSALVSFAGNGSFDLNGHNETFGALEGPANRAANSRVFNSQSAPVTLTIGGANLASTEFAGRIEGAVNLEKTGNGILILSGANNTYSGTTTVNAGILQVGNGVNPGTIGDETNITPVVVNAGGSLAFNRNVTTTFDRNITGDGSLIKSGNGLLLLNGDNAYTGITTVNAGALEFGTPSATTVIRVASGARLIPFENGILTLSGNATSYAGHTGNTALPPGNKDIEGGLNITGGHTFSVGAADVVATLDIQSSLELNAGKLTVTVGVGEGGSVVNDKINATSLNVSAATDASSKFTIDLNFTDGVQASPNGLEKTIIHWTDGATLSEATLISQFKITPDPATFHTPRDGANPVSIQVAVDNAGGNLLLKFEGEGNHSLSWRSSGSSNWLVPSDYATAEKSWFDQTAESRGEATTVSAFYDYDLVRFDSDLDYDSSGSILISSVVRPSRITVTGSRGIYSFTNQTGGKITGDTGIVMNSSRGLKISGANDFTGVVEITNGKLIAFPTATTLALGADGQASALGAGSGAASIFLDRGGALVLDKGNTAVNAIVTSRSFTLGTTGGTSSTTTASIEIGDAEASTPAPRLAVFNGTEPVAFRGDGNRILALGGIAGAPTINQAQDFLSNQERGGGVFQLPLNDPFSGKLSLIKSGTGTWFLQPVSANTYSGDTTINGGTLSIATVDALGLEPETFVAGNLTISGGTLANYKYVGDGTVDVSGVIPFSETYFTAHDLVFGENRGISIGAGGAVFEVGNATDGSSGDLSIRRVTLNGTLASNSKLIKTGEGVLQINGANTAFAGVFAIEKGTVEIGNSSALGTTMSGAGIYLGASTTLNLQGHDLNIRSFLNKTATQGTNAPLTANYAPSRSVAGVSTGTILNEVEKSGSVTLTLGPLAGSEMEVSSFSGTIRELDARVTSVTVINPDTNLEETRDALSYPSPIALIKRSLTIFNLELAPRSNFTGSVTVEGGILRLGLGISENPIGNATSIIVKSGAVLDLYGNQIQNSVLKDRDDTEILLNGQPVILQPTIYIEGSGRQITLTGLDNQGVAESDRFQGWTGALTSLVPHVEPPTPATPGNPGSPGTPQPTGSYAGNIVLTNSARISTALSFGLGKVRGTGDLTLSSLIGGVQYDTVLENDPEKFYINGINTDSTLNDNGIFLLAREGDYTPGLGTGRLLLQTKLAVTAGTTAIVVPGGISIGTSGTSVGRLVLKGVNLPTNTYVFDSDFETGNTAGKLIPPLSLSAAGATLVLADDTRQVLNYFRSANAATFVTHEGTGSGMLILDIPLALPTVVPDESTSPSQYFQYTGKIGSEPLPAGSPEDAVVPPTSKQVNLVKRGEGTYRLSGSNSDYNGYTFIEQGVLELNAPLTVAATDGSTNSTGVLGDPSNTEARNFHILDGSTLRDVSTTRSETRRLFQMSGIITIESSGQGDNPTTPGLQFLGTGRIEFESPNRNVELILGGNKTPANNLTSLNRFAPSLSDPSTSHAYKLSLRKTGGGTWQLEGNNSYTGTTYIDQGTLILGSSSALPVGTSVQFGPANGYGYASGWATLRLNGNSVTLENPVSVGEYYSAWQNRIINGLAGSTPTLTLNVPNLSSSYNFAGSLGWFAPGDGTLNTLNLVKIGPGTQNLSGDLYYTGDTEIREGTLRLSGYGDNETFASRYVFVAPPYGTPEPDSAPQLDVEGLTAFYVNSGTTLVAGNPAKVTSYRDIPEGGGIGTMRYRVEVNTRTDLQGKIHLAGGTLFVGGTKELVPDVNDDGSIIGNKTVIKDNVIGSALTIDGWLETGGLYSDEDTTSTINFTFGTKAIVIGQDIPEDLIENATAKLPVSDLLRVGILRFDGPVVIRPSIPQGDLGGYRLEAGTTTSPANYALIRYTTPPSTSTVANLEYGLRDPRYIISFVNSIADSTIYMSVVATDSQNNLYWLGSPFTNWGDPATTGSNFTQAGVGITSFSPGDHAIFDDRVADAAHRVITVVPEGVQLGAATFDNSLGHDYTLTGGSLIDVLPNDAGEVPEEKGYLEKLGTGTLYISNANTYSGGTILGGGRIVVASLSTGNPLGTGSLFLQGGTLSSSANFILTNEVNVQGTAAIETSLTANITIAGQILDGATGSAPALGNGVLVKTGPGKLLIQGDASQFSGTVRVDEDTVVLGENAKPEKTNFVLNNGTTLTANYDTTTENRGEILLGNLAGTGTITNTTLGPKTFVIGSRGTSADEAPSVFSGVISDGLNGAVSFRKVGTGTLVFAGLNPGNYSGGTTVENGVLQVGYNNRNGSLGLGDILLAPEGTLRFNGDRTESANLVNKISGTGTLVKQNTNTLLILNDNTDFYGNIVIENGELRVGDNTGTGSIGNATVVNDATLIFNRGGGDYTLTNAISGSGELQKVDAGKLTFLGENTSTGQTLVYSGTFAIGNGTHAQNLNYSSSTLYLRGSVLELNPGPEATIALGSDITGTSGTVRQNGPGDVYFVGTATLAGTVNLEAGRFHIGNGGDVGSIEGSAQIHVNSGAELWLNRSGTLDLSGRIFSSGRIVLVGGSEGTGTTILSENNEISGTVSVSNRAILQIGNGGRTGSFNSTKDTVNIQLATGAILAYDLNGENVTTGESVVIVGGGSFVKRGTGTVTFNSIANHTGGTIVENGRLIMDTTRLPRALLDPAYNPNHTAYLAAEGNGTLELRNGSTPFPLEAYIRGTGTIALGADSTLSGGTYTQFDFIPVNAAQTLHALEVGAHANFNLGSDSYARVNANEVRLLNEGLLTGQATLTGDLHIERGADVRPSSSTAIGTLTLEGSLVSDGNITLDFTRDNITGEFIYDTIHFRGTATFNSGSSIFLDISNLGNDFPETITTFPLIIDDEPWNPEGGNNVTGSFIQTNRELDRYGYVYNNGRNIVLIASKTGAGIWDIPGLHGNLPERLVSFTQYLDTIMRDAAAAPNDAARLETMRTVNALLLYRDGPLAAISATAPAGLAALTASPISSAHEAAATMRSHLESIRYDRVINARRVRGSDLTGDPKDEKTLVNVSETGVLAYVSGAASTTKNGSAADSPAFDLNNYAGSVGFDFLLGTGFNIGVNAAYNRSHASLHHGGGKVDADTGRASVYASFMPSSRFFFDAQAFGGYTTYKYNRSTALTDRERGVKPESAKPDGYDYGANAYVGTVLSVNEWIHFTPYAGFEFVHTTVDSYTEDGSIAALRVQEVTQDSLLLKIGTGLNWVKPLSKTIVARFTLDAAFAIETLDTDARITAAFANDTSGNRFRFEAPARPERTLQVGPAVELSIGYNQSLSLGYTYEADFNNYTNHHVNATYRFRF